MVELIWVFAREGAEDEVRRIFLRSLWLDDTMWCVEARSATRTDTYERNEFVGTQWKHLCGACKMKGAIHSELRRGINRMWS